MTDVIFFKPYENLFASMTVQAVEAFSRNNAILWFIARLDQTTGAYGLITAVASMYFPITCWAPVLPAQFHNLRMPRSQVMIPGAIQLAQSLQEALEPTSQLGQSDVAFDANEAPHMPLGVHLPWHGQSAGTGPTFFCLLLLS